MSKTDPTLAPKLARAPTYQAALRGAWTAPGMPNTPGYRAMQLRAAARQDGIDIPAGYAFDADRGFYDANADHWYSDPRVIGPLAVAATGAGLGLFAAPGAAAGSAGASLPGAAVPTSVGMNAVPAAIGSQGVSAGIAATPALGNVNHVVDALSQGGTVEQGATGGASAIEKIRKALTSGEGLASLGGLIAALATNGGGGGNGSAGTDELRRIQAITEARMRRADPLHQVAVQLAYNRSPVSARDGISLANVPLPK